MNRSNRLPKIPHAALVRAPGLLPMLYRISEIAADLQVSEDQIRYWMGQGMPVEHDAQAHLWIDGEEVQRWFGAIQDRRKQRRLRAGRAFCFRCDCAVEFRASTRSQNGNHVLESGICPNCGTPINRGVKYESQPG